MWNVYPSLVEAIKLSDEDFFCHFHIGGDKNWDSCLIKPGTEQKRSLSPKQNFELFSRPCLKDCRCFWIDWAWVRRGFLGGTTNWEPHPNTVPYCFVQASSIVKNPCKYHWNVRLLSNISALGRFLDICCWDSHVWQCPANSHHITFTPSFFQVCWIVCRSLCNK